MTLILTVRNAATLPGAPMPPFRVESEAVVIGRSPDCDWHLPDPTDAISSRHCEIRRAGETWVLTDISAAGTFLNDAAGRLAGEHRLAEGDLIRIGDYEIVASFDGCGVTEGALPGTDAATVDKLVQSLIESAGLEGADLARSAELIGKAGALLKRLVAGLLVMVEARARANAQIGAETAAPEREGDNPVKVARNPDQALEQLLSAPQPGFMAADRAIDDAFFDLQSDQLATLKAIPGVLRATLDRFSPGSIQRRHGGDLGLLAKLLPAFRDAAFWRRYERDFAVVTEESDEAFMAVFAKEFRKACERQLDEGIGR